MTLQQIYDEYENARLMYYDPYMRTCDDESFRKRFLEAQKRLEEAIESINECAPVAPLNEVKQ